MWVSRFLTVAKAAEPKLPPEDLSLCNARRPPIHWHLGHYPHSFRRHEFFFLENLWESVFTSGNREPISDCARKIKASESKLSKPLIIKLVIEKCRINSSWSHVATNSPDFASKAVTTLSFSAPLSLFGYSERAGLPLILHYYSSHSTS